MVTFQQARGVVSFHLVILKEHHNLSHIFEICQQNPEISVSMLTAGGEYIVVGGWRAVMRKSATQTDAITSKNSL